jgi:hypothetical protein
MGQMRNAHNPKGKKHLENLDLDGRIILKCILKKYDTRVWTRFISYRIGTSGKLFEPAMNFRVS